MADRDWVDVEDDDNWIDAPQPQKTEIEINRELAQAYLERSNPDWNDVLPEGYVAPGEKSLGAAIRHGLETAGVRGVKGLVGLAKAETELGTAFRKRFYDTGIGATLRMTAKSMGLDPEVLFQKMDGALDEWVDTMAQGLDTYAQENDAVSMQLDEDDGFFETTFDILKNPEKILQGVVEAIPLMLEAGLGTVLAGPAGGIAVMSQPIAGETYMNARNEGTAPMKALVQAELTGLGEAAIEQWTFGKKLGLAKGFKKVIESGGRKILWEGAKLYGRGMVEEGAQQFNQNVWNWFFTDRSQDVTEDVLQSAAIGGPMELVMGGGFAAAGGAYSKLVGPMEQRAIVEKMRKEVEESPTLSQEFKDELNEEFEQVIYDIAEEKYAEAPAEDEGNFVFDENGEFIGERDPQSALTEEEKGLGRIANLPVSSLITMDSKNLKGGLTEEYEQDIKDFMVRMEQGEVFPPIPVFKSKTGKILLTDGHRRLEAQRRLGRETVEVTFDQQTLTMAQIGDRVVEGEEIDGIAEEIEEDTRTLPEKAVDKLRELVDTILVDNIRDTTKTERDRQLGSRIHKAEQARSKALKDKIPIKDAQRIAKAIIRGELAKAIFPAFTAEQFSPNEWEQVRQAVLDKGMKFFDEEHAIEAINKLQDGVVPPPFEMDALGQVIGEAQAEAIIDKASGIKGKILGFIKELINLPVTLLASSEVSMIGRQGATALVKWPVKWTKALIHSYRAYFSDEWAQMKQNDLLTRELNDQAVGHGLEMTDMDASQSKRHERFQSTWAKKLPFIGVLVRASERAAVVGMNSLRAQIYDQYAEDWEGVQPTSEYIKLAKIANAATGRGNITNKQIKGMLLYLNAIFFSPRYVWSRFELAVMGAKGIVDIITPGKAAASSKIMADMTVRFVSAGLVAMAIATALGADVEDDPQSSDYGKIKYGRTRFDVWGGYQQIARTVAQMMTGKGKSTSGEKEFYTKSRLETFGRFVQSKLSPLGALTVEMLSGKDFLGEPIPKFKDNAEFLEWAVYKKFTPLIFQDTIEAIQYAESLPATLMAFPAAFHGIGVQTYDRKAIDDLTEMQDFYAKRIMHKPWKDLGPDAQKALREYRPQIGQQEAIAKFERRNASFDMAKQREAGVEIEESLPDRVQQELKDSQATVGGLARTITRNWRLNKDRYQAYKDGVSHVLKQALPKIIDTAAYQSLAPQDRQVLLNEVVKQAKDAVRKDIVLKANMNDLEDMRKGVEND